MDASEARQAEAKAWLNKARHDLRCARIDMDADPPELEDALFHCQQAVEKALKAFLTVHDCIFRKTHDLDELAAACERIDHSLMDVSVPARDLTVFAWEYRYPGTPDVPSKVETREAFDLADRLLKAILDRLGHQV